MWTTNIDYLQEDKCKVILLQDNEVLLYSEVIELLKSDSDFRTFFNATIANLPFEAIFWETPPVNTSNFDRAFEFMAIESWILPEVDPDPSPFQSYFFNDIENNVVTFPNLGRNAVLVAPCPKVQEKSAYTHLIAFARQAPEEQQDKFWQMVGKTVKQNLSKKPLWLNTEGTGVYWLHIRLDSRPKYYHHHAYKKW